MKCYLYQGERLVFEEEGWGIIIDDGHVNRSYTEGFVYGTHQACTVPYDLAREPQHDEYSYGENCWSPVSDDGYDNKGNAVCCICNAAVPEGIQALILLQAWADQGVVRNEKIHKRR